MSESTDIRKQVRMEDASRAQLMEFAAGDLGLTIHHACNAETIINKIKEAWDKDYILVIRTPEPGVELSEPKVTVFISEQTGPGGKRPVPLSVNGRTMLVPRNTDCAIPYSYYMALTAARETIHEYEEQPGSNDKVLVEKNVPSYPFQPVAMPSQAEIEAWKASRNPPAKAA